MSASLSKEKIQKASLKTRQKLKPYLESTRLPLFILTFQGSQDQGEFEDKQDTKEKHVALEPESYLFETDFTLLRYFSIKELQSLNLSIEKTNYLL